MSKRKPKFKKPPLVNGNIPGTDFYLAYFDDLSSKQLFKIARWFQSAARWVKQKEARK